MSASLDVALPIELSAKLLKQKPVPRALNAWQVNLVALWLATMGADRIDLLSGHGPLALTPFLLLSPLTAAVVICAAPHQKPLRVPSSLVLPLVGYLAVAFLSDLLNSAYSPGAGRVILVAFESIWAILVVGGICASTNGEAALLRGATMGLMLGVIFDYLQLRVWSGSTFSMPWLNISPADIGVIIPRLTLQSLDPNRGAFLAVIYTWILLSCTSGKRRTRALMVAVAMVMTAATFSRSGMLMLLVVLIPKLRTARHSGVVPSRRWLLGAIMAFALSAYLFGLPGHLTFGRLSDALHERLGGGLDGSSNSIHFSLLRLGLETSTQSLRAVCCGHGFGNSGDLLQQFFPNNSHANWHSLPISTLVELGAIGSAFMLFLLLWPALTSRSSRGRGLCLAICIFSITYDLQLEPSFWVALALVWYTVEHHAPNSIRRRW